MWWSLWVLVKWKWLFPTDTRPVEEARTVRTVVTTSCSQTRQLHLVVTITASQLVPLTLKLFYLLESVSTTYCLQQNFTTIQYNLTWPAEKSNLKKYLPVNNLQPEIALLLIKEVLSFLFLKINILKENLNVVNDDLDSSDATTTSGTN